jgi:hypothetical protein
MINDMEKLLPILKYVDETIYLWETIWEDCAANESTTTNRIYKCSIELLGS